MQVWAVSLSTTKLSPRRLTRVLLCCGIRSWIGVGNQHLAPSPVRALPPQYLRRGCTSIHFGENQLSPRSVGISPLSTGHLLLVLQPHPLLREDGLGCSRFARHYYGNLG